MNLIVSASDAGVALIPLSAVGYANELIGSILLCIDPFASFKCVLKQKKI